MVSDKKKKNHERASLTKRGLAFLIDIFFVTIAATLLSVPFVDAESISKLDADNQNLIEKYETGEISVATYYIESMNVSYQTERKSGIMTLFYLLVAILYFILFQKKNKGQTIGKKWLKIRVVSTNGEELSTNQMMIRSLICNSILANMLVFAIVVFGTKSIYLYLGSFVEILQGLLIIICIIMVMFTAEGKGLHDVIAKTMVVKDNTLKELEK